MRILLALTAAFCFLFPAQSQLLWKISENGLPQPSYIFGTHHIASLSICDSIEGFDEAFSSCAQFYGEIQMDSMNTPAFQQKIAAYMMLPQDSMLDKLYSPEDYRFLDSILQEYLGVEANQVKMLKPAALEAQIAVVQSMEVFPGYNPNSQLDATLQKRAKEQEKPVFGLETAEFQMEKLMGNSIRKQADDLLKSIKTGGGSAEYAKKMADLYMQQDINRLFVLMLDPALGFDKSDLERLVYDRNRDWAEKLQNILPERSTFIVVGAGHLPGGNGLLELLRKQGYTVEAVR